MDTCISTAAGIELLEEAGLKPLLEPTMVKTMKTIECQRKMSINLSSRHQQLSAADTPTAQTA
jgi:hypothetical protein